MCAARTVSRRRLWSPTMRARIQGDEQAKGTRVPHRRFRAGEPDSDAAVGGRARNRGHCRQCGDTHIVRTDAGCRPMCRGWCAGGRSPRGVGGPLGGIGCRPIPQSRRRPILPLETEGRRVPGAVHHECARDAQLQCSVRRPGGRVSVRCSARTRPSLLPTSRASSRWFTSTSGSNRNPSQRRAR